MHTLAIYTILIVCVIIAFILADKRMQKEAKRKDEDKAKVDVIQKYKEQKEKENKKN